MTHTPGPWRQGVTLTTAQTRGWNAEQIARNDAIELARVFSGFRAEDQGRSRQIIAECFGPHAEANARLIAAAPEMAAELRELIEHCLHVPMCGCDATQNDPSCRVGRARALVAKIDGGAR